MVDSQKLLSYYKFNQMQAVQLNTSLLVCVKSHMYNINTALSYEKKVVCDFV